MSIHYSSKALSVVTPISWNSLIGMVRKSPGDVTILQKVSYGIIQQGISVKGSRL